MQKMVLVCGIPGSGKTTFSDSLAEKTGFTHIDVDDVYADINGDARDRSNKFEVWQEFFRRIHVAQQAGKSVIVDTMALLAYNRREFIEWFPEFDEHHLIFIEAEFNICVRNVQSRERVIPEALMRKFFQIIEYPTEITDPYWDTISWYSNDGREIKREFNEAMLSEP